MAVAKIKYGLQKEIYLGNLDAKRDWGYSKEYVEAMWMMLQHDTPKDFVIASGKTHSVREFVQICFKLISKTIVWQGEGVNEIGIDNKTGNVLIKIDSRYFRPTEVNLLLGDPTKARKELVWRAKTRFAELVNIMLDYDLNKIGKLLNYDKRF